jgi:hypothetical protein
MSRFLPALHVLLALVMYGVNANFTILLFTSGFTGWEYIVRFTFALGFEGFKVAVWVEGIVRHSIWLKLLALSFSLGSLMTATLGMVLGELLDTERKVAYVEAEGAALAGVNAEIEAVQRQLETEQERLEEGSAIYRTDARETRASIDKLMGRLSQLYGDKAKLSEEALASSESAGIKKNPLAQVSELLGPKAQTARMGFGGYQALMLELGGMASAALSIRKKRKEDSGEKEVKRRVSGGSSVVESPLESVARIAFEPKARNGSFPSFIRCKEVISKPDYNALVKVGLLAGVLRQSHRRYFIAKGIDKAEFLKEVQAWPE